MIYFSFCFNYLHKIFDPQLNILWNVSSLFNLCVLIEYYLLKKTFQSNNAGPGIKPVSGGARPPPGGHVIQASDDDDEEDDDEEEDEDESSDEEDAKADKNHEGFVCISNLIFCLLF